MTKATWIIIFAARLILNTSFSIAYPFLPAIARGLSVPFEDAGFLVAMRSLAGLTGAFSGLVADRRGFRFAMIGGLLLLVAGAGTLFFSHGFAAALVAFAFLGLAKTVYDPAAQAFVSIAVPYRSRARAVGFMEASFAGSWLIGLPVCGVLMEHLGWRSPFLVLAVLGLLWVFVTTRLKDAAAGRRAPAPPAPAPEAVMSAPPPARIIPVLAMTCCMTLAHETMYIVYGAWLEAGFGLRVESLGFLSILMGVFTLAGDLTVALFVDRIGKRRALASALGLAAGSFLLLPLIGSSAMMWAAAGLCAMFYLCEVSIVSSFAFVSEMAPGARGAWLAANYGVSLGGRLAGSVAGPWLWNLGAGLWPNAALAAALSLSAMCLLLWATRGRAQD